MMTVAAPSRPAVCYRDLYPAWVGKRPLPWFFAEELLEARSDSVFPTNERGNDEDVNIYLIHLLTSWATVETGDKILPGRDPLLLVPDLPAGRRQAAEHYRRQADHRLLGLGLFDRGDLFRRRKIGWRMTEDETRRLDMTVAERCYSLAAAMLTGQGSQYTGLQAVWRKLASHMPDYVQVLQTLARRRFGLGAKLNAADLARLLAVQ
jgi:hypothetical protein